jgi:sigma-B regulation protein RsbU (phosphoserine phosphatase)
LFVATAPRSLSPREVTLAVHKALLEVSPSSDMFVTVFYAVLHGPTGRLRYVRAGQDRPLLFRVRESAPIEIDATGRFLGMLEELELEERGAHMLPGDTLVMYSDGVTDAVNGDGEPFGLERLRQILQKHRAESPDTLCTSVFRDVFAYRGTAPAFDDITVLVAKAGEYR